MSRIVTLHVVRNRRNVDHLHRLGPRALYEFLGMLGADEKLWANIEELLQIFYRDYKSGFRKPGGAA